MSAPSVHLPMSGRGLPTMGEDGIGKPSGIAELAASRANVGRLESRLRHVQQDTSRLHDERAKAQQELSQAFAAVQEAAERNQELAEGLQQLRASVAVRREQVADEVAAGLGQAGGDVEARKLRRDVERLRTQFAAAETRVIEEAAEVVKLRESLAKAEQEGKASTEASAKFKNGATRQITTLTEECAARKATLEETEAVAAAAKVSAIQSERVSELAALKKEKAVAEGRLKSELKALNSELAAQADELASTSRESEQASEQFNKQLARVEDATRRDEAQRRRKHQVAVGNAKAVVDSEKLAASQAQDGMVRARAAIEELRVDEQMMASRIQEEWHGAVESEQEVMEVQEAEAVAAEQLAQVQAMEAQQELSAQSEKECFQQAAEQYGALQDSLQMTKPRWTELEAAVSQSKSDLGQLRRAQQELQAELAAADDDREGEMELLRRGHDRASEDTSTALRQLEGDFEVFQQRAEAAVVAREEASRELEALAGEYNQAADAYQQVAAALEDDRLSCAEIQDQRRTRELEVKAAAEAWIMERSELGATINRLYERWRENQAGVESAAGAALRREVEGTRRRLTSVRSELTEASGNVPDMAGLEVEVIEHQKVVNGEKDNAGREIRLLERTEQALQARLAATEKEASECAEVAAELGQVNSALENDLWSLLDAGLSLDIDGSRASRERHKALEARSLVVQATQELDRELQGVASRIKSTKPVRPSLDSLVGIVSDLEAQLAASQASVEALVQETEEAQSSKLLLGRERDDLRTQLTSGRGRSPPRHGQRLAELQRDLLQGSARSESSRNLEEVERINSRIAQVQRAVATLEEQVLGAEDRLTNVGQTEDQLVERRRLAEEKLQEAAGQLRAIQEEDQGDVTGALCDLEGDCEGLRSDIAMVQAELRAVEQSAEGCRARAQEIRSRLDAPAVETTVSADVAAQARAVAQRQAAALQQARHQLAAAEAQWSEAVRTLEMKRGRVSGLAQQVSGLESTLERAQGVLKAAQQDAQRAQDDADTTVQQVERGSGRGLGEEPLVSRLALGQRQQAIGDGGPGGEEANGYPLSPTSSPRNDIQSVATDTTRASTPADAVEVFQRAMILSDNEQYEESADLCRQLVNRGPRLTGVHESEVWAQLGVNMQSMDRADDALAAFRQAVNLNPRLHPCHANLAMILNYQRKNAEAADHIMEALRYEPQNPEYLSLLQSINES
mmetsp:Transcript_22878/g.51748  ORF Transcript_22878/g.51748 Transcript_22878/m.51748 type:complete len:1206 (-) Transcript_22878:157-3774(-)